MSKVRGIVTQLKGNSCVLLTPEGEFIKANAPKHAKVGQEIEVSRRSQPWFRFGAAVAAALILSLLLPFYPLLTASAKPVAYLSLDINPSLELAVNKSGTVVEGRSFNPEGQTLLDKTSINKLDVYTALRSLIEQAVAEGYLTGEKANLVVAAYTENTPFSFDRDKLEGAVKQQISAANLTAEILVSPTSLEMHKQAEANMVSQGRYLLYQDAKAKDSGIKIEDFKQGGINKALQSNGVQLEDIAPGVDKVGPGIKTEPKNKPKEDKKTPPEKEQGGQDRGKIQGQPQDQNGQSGSKSGSDLDKHKEKPKRQKEEG